MSFKAMGSGNYASPCIRDMHGNGNYGDGIPWVPWDSHGNGSNSDYIMGTGMGVGIKVWEWNIAVGMGINSHCSFSQYHMRISSAIRELAKPSHFTFTMARRPPEHVINPSRTVHRTK